MSKYTDNWIEYHWAMFSKAFVWPVKNLKENFGISAKREALESLDKMVLQLKQEIVDV